MRNFREMTVVTAQTVNLTYRTDVNGWWPDNYVAPHATHGDDVQRADESSGSASLAAVASDATAPPEWSRCDANVVIVLTICFNRFAC